MVRVASLLLLACAVAGSLAAATFHDAYRRGLAAERAGRWQEARQALLEAARKHPEPARRVRTYGLNFVENYDPYLHLARVEVELGLFDEASEHLARSRRAGVSPAPLLARIARRVERGRRLSESSPPPAAAPPAPAARAPQPAPPTTVLALDSRPGGADVFVDGRLLGVTPVELPVTAGSHRLELRAEGHRAARKQIEIRSGQRLSWQIELEALPPVSPAAPLDKQAATPLVPSPRAPTSVATVQPASPQAVAPAPPSREKAMAEAMPALVAPTEETPPPPAAPPVQRASTQAAAPVAVVPAGQEPDVPHPLTGDDPAASSPASMLLLLLAAGGALAVLALVAVRRTLRASRRPPADPRTRSAIETQDMPRTGLTPAIPGPGATAAGAGSTFGGYQLLALLGRGGMASTYRARRRGDDREMAIKIPYAHLLEQQEFVARFLREGALGATLHHPNIVRIYRAGEEQGVPFIAMELLGGETLEERIARVGRLELRDALDILRGIALALDYAHLKGVVHRDLKPENVMCLAEGGVKVMDYGIARVLDGSNLTASHSFLGTPNYAAPESFDPSKIDGRSDLYSLGIIAYRMLAGCLPFTGSSPLEILDQHRRAPLPSLPEEAAVPPRVEAMVRRLAAKSPASRFDTAEALLRELNAILNTLAETSTTEPARL